MSKFESITLVFGGKKYVIPANRVMGAILSIEDHLTLDQLYKYADSNTAPLGKISVAYAAVLRYAGAEVADEDVYVSLFGREDPTAMATAVHNLMRMMLPPAELAKIGGDATAPKGKAKDSSSSKKPTSRRLGTTG